MINECDISDQIGPGRKIKIEIMYALENFIGRIIVSKTTDTNDTNSSAQRLRRQNAFLFTEISNGSVEDYVQDLGPYT